ncbi:MAG: ATP-dependent DNA helicase RecG, partial [Ignavibacteria bacterium]|nr:ATP-dependent DNA helicase RecG [Ignavibacteria bacterium]
MKQVPPPTRQSADPPVQFLKGIGPVRASVLAGLGIRTLRDLLFYVPRRYLDRSQIVTIARLRELASGKREGETGDGTGPSANLCTVLADVRSFRTIGYGRKARFVLIAADETGSLQCVWFGGVQYWKNRFQIGETIAVSGTPSFYGHVLQVVHPETDQIAPRSGEGDPASGEIPDLINTGGMVPIYPSGRELERVGLHSGGMRRVIQGLLRTHLSGAEDPLPRSILAKRNLLPFDRAVRQVHRPDSPAALEEGLRRLKYEELFMFQTMLARQRERMRSESTGISFSVRSRLAREMVNALPFKLTEAQVRVINEITADMESDRPLNRLLQGDVGSGKTVVALAAMLIAVDNGFQAAIMAPTELLAEQHYRTLVSFIGSLDVNVRLLTGKKRTRLRRDILEDVSRGSAQIVVGTHALFEEGVEFARLGFVVIDEQHRFGVRQRARLLQKGVSPDLLVMTATPIPRTLSLTVYGDLDVSIIDQLPKGRRPVETILRSDHQKEEVFQLSRTMVRSGRQAYYVYPVIEESEKTDLKAALVHYEEMKKTVFPDLRLGLLHGRMPSDEKEDVMQRFKEGEIDILVATTVVEVGIDVPNATLMVIENAERFGLSQLHQLRGRVGRGSERSVCVLLAGKGAGTGPDR